MNCQFTQLSDKVFLCQVCDRTVVANRHPRANCQGQQALSSPLQPEPSRFPNYLACQHRGERLDDLNHCGCGQSPATFHCNRFDERVTLRRVSQSDFRNCLDCLTDG